MHVCVCKSNFLVRPHTLFTDTSKYSHQVYIYIILYFNLPFIAI